MKLREIYPTVDAVRTKLREELNQATKEKADVCRLSQLHGILISLCKDGTILNSKGADWQQVRYRAMLPP